MQAIDIHVHLSTEVVHSKRTALQEDGAKQFKMQLRSIPIEETAAMYKQLQMKAVLLVINSEAVSGVQAVSNDYLAAMVQRFPDVFFGFGSVDPWQGMKSVTEIQRFVRELHLIGLKLHPNVQGFYPNDRRFYPLYETCAQLQIPVLFHTGFTAIGANSPGGRRLHLDYSRPIYLDDVAADFPELTIIGAHPSWPWQEEALAVAQHKANVYIDLSGWSPKYFSASLVRSINHVIPHKFLFGSDYPYLMPERWMRDFAQLPIEEQIKPLIFYENARKILQLGR